tara:strand:- start:381 stop:521 length:141 start_codon:yes stop_codon:yes gene_type:complete
MGFGGGGGASSGVSAHKHTNETGEGGALDDTSLLNNDTIEGLILTM